MSDIYSAKLKKKSHITIYSTNLLYICAINRIHIIILGRLFFRFLTVSSLLCFFSCAPKTEEGYDPEKGFTGSISASGAFALYPIVVLWGEDFKTENENVRFNISAGGAGKGIADVLTNMVDIGLVSRDINAQEYEKGALPIHVAKDAVICTFNQKHPNYDLLKSRGLTKDELANIFVYQKYKSWKDIDPRFVDAPIDVYVRSDAAGAAETWAKFFGKHQDDLKGVGIFGDPGVAQVIKDRPLSIGFNNINYVYSLTTKKVASPIDVIPLDTDGNGQIDVEENFYDTLDELMEAVALSKYPSPPSRDLTFVVRKDKQSLLINEFIRFVLKEEQQGYLIENGYVPLTKEQVEVELKKLSK